MAVKTRNSNWQTLHFLARLIGLTAVAAALGGCFIWGVLGEYSFGPYEVAGISIDKFLGEDVGLIVMCLSAAAVVLSLLFEVRGITQTVASHRGLFGFNVVVQIALALGLVVGANVYSFEHYRRFDWTRGQIFTLDKETRDQLTQLRGETEIVVVQNYVSFGQRADNKQDKYDFAAQRKIVEKVKDLAEEFEDIGPRFHVRVLDIQEDSYDKKLDEIRKDVSEDLANAIEKAPENSVFFYSREKNRIQRISFSDIYQLDKRGSIENKNLVLKYQGVGPFARKIFNIEEKSPRIALGVSHPLLGFENHRAPEYTMNGAKKVLDARGFECTDLMLRKLERGWPQTEPIVLSHDESRYEQIEDIVANVEKSAKQIQKELDARAENYHFWKDSSLATLNTKYIYVVLRDGRQGVQPRKNIDALMKTGLVHKTLDVDEDDRRSEIAPYLILKDVLDNQLEERDNLLKEKATLRADNLSEKRRLTDVELKAKAMLANVDLLIIPRMTLRNIPAEDALPNRFHHLDAAHLSAIKAFLKQGKPVLFLLGPTNEDPEAGPDTSPPDQLESMLAELGFHLPKQTILYNMETREYNQSKFGGTFGKSKSEVEIPGLNFDDMTETGLRTKFKDLWLPHPIRTSLKVMNRTTAEKRGEEARVRHPRPVYRQLPPLSPEAAATLVAGLGLPGMGGPVQAPAIWLSAYHEKYDESAVFLATRKDSWNEENPFIIDNKIPRYTPAKDTDPKKNTIEEERRGPFPIGVAIDAPLPPAWFGKDETSPERVRVAVIGSGGVFSGQSLPPLKEKMLLDTVNWLLGRDDLLARDADTWQYPRVALSPFEHKCWYAICYGLPCLFVYLGTIVWLLRRMR